MRLRFAGIGQAELSGSGMTLGRLDHELCPQRGEPANARLVDLPQCPSAPISLPYGHSHHEGSMFMKPTRTWILIADGARARIGPNKGLEALHARGWHGDHAATHELMSDRTGGAFSSTGPSRSASSPIPQLKRNLAHRLADALAHGWCNRAYNRSSSSRRRLPLGICGRPLPLRYGPR